MLCGADAAGACVGDEDGDGKVAINELILGVTIGLGAQPVAAAPSFDADRDGAVGINELIMAVGNALGVCASPIPPDADLIKGASRLALLDGGAVQVLDFGSLGGGGRLQRLRASAPTASGNGGAAGAACVVGSFSCAGGGSRSVQCSVSGGRSVLIEVLSACVEGRGDDGGQTTRTGRRERTIDDADFCSTCVVPDGVADTTRLVDYEVDFACDAGCPAGLQRASLAAAELRMVRRPSGDALETVLTGDLTVENGRTGERFEQRFSPAGLTITEGASGGMPTFKLSGSVTVQGCLGPLTFTTEDPIAFAPEAKCPSAGLLQVALAGPLGEGLAAAPFAAAARLDTAAGDGAAAGAGAGAGAGYRDRAFRSINGLVYQVLQNAGGDPEVGADDFRVTTVAGSAVELFPCQAQPVTRDRPQVAAALGVDPLEPARITVSGRIADASPPCFNPTARDGDGLICIGPGCNPDSCLCTDTARCATFTRADGATLESGADGVPPALLLDAADARLDARCPQAGYATYAFGSDEPTTSILECGPDPDDGVLLPLLPSGFGAQTAGSSVVLAYDAPFGRRFVTGSGALSVDRDGDSACGRDQVTLPIHATQDVSLPPRVSFRAAGVQLNYNADTVVDETLSSCEDVSLLRCRVAGGPTPTPNAQCSPTEFLGDDFDRGVTRFDSTVENRSGGASCGGGGNAADDFAYLFKAPQAGFYTFDTTGSSFDTVLYVRDATCDGPELACNDDRDSTSVQSRLGLSLRAGQRVLVFVDGFASDGGRFSLTIRRSGSSTPTPTPIPTAGPGGPTLPDLRVEQLSAQIAAGASVVDVSATLSNAGSASGAVTLELVFSSDAVIDAGDLRTGVGCQFASLSAQASAICAGPLPVPSALPAGLYFVGAVADPNDSVVESDESNNTAAAGPITVGAGSPTRTPTATRTPPATGTATASASATPTQPAATSTATATPTPSAATATASATPTPPVATASPSATPTIGGITPGAPTATGTVTGTATSTSTRTRTPSRTATNSPTRTPTATPTGPMNIVFARPVGASLRDVASAGQVVIAAGSQQTVSVTLLPSPTGSPLAVTVSSGNAAVATVLGTPMIAAGSRAVELTIQAGTAGTAVLRIRAGGEVRDLTVVVGEAAAANLPVVAAPLVGATLRSVPSAGPLFLAPGQALTATVTLLAAPAAGAIPVAVTSSDAAVVAVEGSVTVANGARTATLPLRAGSAGTSTLRLRAGADVRDLTIYVGVAPPGGFPPVMAPVVGTTLRSVPSAGPLYLAPAQQLTATVTLLAAPTAGALPVTVTSSDAAVVTVGGAVTIAAGARTAALAVHAGVAGSATLRLRAGDVVRDLQVFVGTPPGAGVPAIVAPAVGVQKP